MKKLSLDMDSLRVESFETHPEARGPRGTVHGNLVAQSYFNDCVRTWYCLNTYKTCPDTGIEQCGYSYGGTCGASPPITYDGCLAADGEAAVAPPPYLCA